MTVVKLSVFFYDHSHILGLEKMPTFKEHTHHKFNIMKFTRFQIHSLHQHILLASGALPKTERYFNNNQ